MVFDILLSVGLLGFVAMAALGFLHGGGHRGGHHSSHGHHGHGGGRTHGHHAPASGRAHGSQPAHSHKSDSGGQREAGNLPHWGPARLLPFISPLNLFSMALGAGATGKIAQSFVSGPTLVLLAIAGGLVFDLAIVRPLMNLIIRFGSEPSEGLEGTVASTAEAVSGFDKQGRGLVKLTLDGQIVQLLGNLDSHELSEGKTVHKGEQLLVMEVDPAKGTCTVSRELFED